MSADPPARRRAVTYLRLLLAVVLAAGLVSATVAVTRSSVVADGAATGNAAPGSVAQGGTGQLGSSAGVEAAPTAPVPTTTALPAPQRGLAAAAVAAAQSAAGRVGFAAGRGRRSAGRCDGRGARSPHLRDRGRGRRSDGCALRVVVEVRARRRCARSPPDRGSGRHRRGCPPPPAGARTQRRRGDECAVEPVRRSRICTSPLGQDRAAGHRVPARPLPVGRDGGDRERPAARLAAPARCACPRRTATS